MDIMMELYIELIKFLDIFLMKLKTPFKNYNQVDSIISAKCLMSIFHLTSKFNHSTRYQNIQ